MAEAESKIKVGVVSCSGEEIPEGTLSRVATRLVLEKLRPQETVTICLPLFLAGGEAERTFAQKYPTIAVDGCEKLCAKRATEKYSGKVSGIVLISKLLEKLGEEPPRSRADLTEKEMKLAEKIAFYIAQEVDKILESASAEKVEREEVPVVEAAQGVCVCASGTAGPTWSLDIDGRRVELSRLDQIFSQLLEQRADPTPKLKEELLTQVKNFNYVPKEEEDVYKEAIYQAYLDLYQNRTR